MEGTVNFTAVSDQLVTVAAVAPKRMEPVLAPKPFPAIWTETPGWAEVGPMEPTSGVVAVVVFCQTLTAWAGRVNVPTGLLPPVPVVTVMPSPPRRLLR